MKNSDYYSKKSRKIRMDEKKDKVRKTQTMVLFVFFEVLMLMCVTGALFLWILKHMPEKEPDSSLRSVSPDNVSADYVPEEIPEPQAPPALLSQEATPTSISLTWEDTLYDTYAVFYKADGSEHQEYLKKVTDDPEIELTGLAVGTPYTIYITDGEDESLEYLPVFSTGTSIYGYCDPFKAVDAILNVYDRDEETGEIKETLDTATVVMSADEGCLGVTVKPIMTTPLYSDETMSNSYVNLTAGQELHVSKSDNGHYCYLSPGGDWVLHVTVYDEELEKEIAEAEALLKEQDDESVSDDTAITVPKRTMGWVNARTLLVDVRGFFTDPEDLYGIQINRTNAYSSIFTCGGNANEVNTGSDEGTRYDCVSENDANAVLSSDGYNVIDGITGQALPNYGSPDQMPVIWDLALELKTCQETALYAGYTIVIYDGYRPLSTSAAVSGYLADQGYLTYSASGTNLAQGYLTNGTYNINYYIAQKSRHNRGIAADLTIREYTDLSTLGDEAVMQTKMHTLDFRCNMEYNTWAADLLIDIMTAHGSNLEYLRDKQEWWHFQLQTELTGLYPLIDQYGYSDIIF